MTKQKDWENALQNIRNKYTRVGMNQADQLEVKWNHLGQTADYVLDAFKEEMQNLLTQQKKEIVTENTSDGFHTFKELYEFRKIYNALIFNEWAKQGLYNIHKSKKHSDGQECFGGGWFIVVASLPNGDISNHYEMKDWELFKCEERETAKEYDGHTSQDVVERITNILTKE